MMRRNLFASLITEQTASGLRQRFLEIMTAFTTVVTGLIVVVELEVHAAAREPIDQTDLILLVVFGLLNLGLLYLASRNQVRLATLGFLGLATAGVVVAKFTDLEIYSEMLAIFTLIAAAVLGSTSTYVSVNLATCVALAVGVYRELQVIGEIGHDTVIHESIMIVAFVVVSLTMRYFVNTIQRSLAASRRNANLLEVSAEIGQITSRLLKLDELLARSIELIRSRFDFYHVQVFLLNDTRDQAVLVASTGEVGERLLARKHRLAVGSQSIIGQVALRGEAIIASDTDRDAVHARNELLPNTRAELALPILDSGTIIGALDIQSTEADAFQPDDIHALEISANLLATAIRNARLFEEQAKITQDNQRLLEEAKANIGEIERLNQQLTKAGWQAYMSDNKALTGVTLENNRITSETAWTPELLDAGQNRRPVTSATADRQVVAVPVLLRGEVIGAIEVEPEDNASENETIEMVQAVAQRLALSLDNARLFEEAQSATAQEQRINDIVARYQTVNTVDDLLRITLTELTESLGAQRGAIRLGRVENGGSSHE
jgi:GAF domain-containing protein